MTLMLGSSFVSAGKIIIIRHGNAQNNVEDRFNSRLESPPAYLTELGEEQAEKAALELKEIIGDSPIIYFSPLMRTRQTANIIGKSLGLNESQLKEDSALIEVYHGHCEGKKYTECNEFMADAWDLSLAHLFMGETIGELTKRTAEFLERVQKDNPASKDIIVVTHGSPALYLLQHLNPKEYQGFRLINCQFKVIERSSF